MIERLICRRFRCLGEVSLEPGKGFNIIAGQNAQGKTSLLEAIHLCSTGRVWRGSRDLQAIQEGSEDFSVECTLSSSGTSLGVSLVRGGRKRALLNGVGLPRASDLLGRMPTVSFSARDLEIVSGDPADRREFLDEELSQMFPAYLRAFAGYKRALEQRNALLRQSRETGWMDAGLFSVWEAPLAEHGSQLRKMRQSWTEELQDEAKRAHGFLGAGEDLSLDYEARDEGLDEESLRRSRGDDIARGSTGIGPHRDELMIRVAGREARLYASQGQQRTAVIALKLAVQALASRSFGLPPVLLLDDVFSDLDSSRRSRLVSHALQEGGQVFLTCTEAEQAGKELMERSQIFLVQSGQVSKP